MPHPLLVFNPAFLRAPRALADPAQYQARIVATLASNATRGGPDAAFVFNWDSEIEDDGWGWTPGTDAFTVPLNVNTLIISCMLRKTAVDTPDFRLAIDQNGSTVVNQRVTDQGRLAGVLHAVLAVEPGDEIETLVFTSTASEFESGKSSSYICIEGWA